VVDFKKFVKRKQDIDATDLAIEQGMGRAVRSHADYAVILLVGNELAHFIAKHEVLSAMNPDTKTQLKLAIDLAKLAMEDSASSPEEAVIDMMRQCLSRDNGWKQFYNETIRNPPVSEFMSQTLVSLLPEPQSPT
jgi:hypothetical protein